MCILQSRGSQVNNWCNVTHCTKTCTLGDRFVLGQKILAVPKTLTRATMSTSKRFLKGKRKKSFMKSTFKSTLSSLKSQCTIGDHCVHYENNIQTGPACQRKSSSLIFLAVLLCIFKN